ncbi:Os12g0240850 [Oryza sativa Japonica Group]|uniref:Os12g0240850 protein n=1 Tax=Oryza sativa subsp. japonica TaxID=39947 RepID=A0A0P0Y8J4_ORYSJ|nr:Os12g0240850 [Oryza sativa Japonica Group]
MVFACTRCLDKAAIVGDEDLEDGDTRAAEAVHGDPGGGDEDSAAADPDMAHVGGLLRRQHAGAGPRSCSRAPRRTAGSAPSPSRPAASLSSFQMAFVAAFVAL